MSLVSEDIGMMGSQEGGQERLFYSFKLDDHIPSSHLLRGVDRFLDPNEDEFLLAATAQNLRRMAKWLMPDAQRPGVLAV